MSGVIVLVSGESRDSISRKHGAFIWEKLASEGFADKLSVGCVGFLNDPRTGSLAIILPKAFASVVKKYSNKSETYLKDQAFRLIRIFNKIRIQKKFKILTDDRNESFNRQAKKSELFLDSFNAALVLRKDFIKNGLYIKQSAKKTKNTFDRPIDFPSTLQKESPILNDEEVLYLNTVHHSKQRVENHPLCMLQKNVLSKIFKLTGEKRLLKKFDARTFLETEKLLPSIRRLKPLIFDERGLSLLAYIESYIGRTGLKKSDRAIKEELLAYTKDFEDIWEAVLRGVLAPKMGSRALPAGKWYTWPTLKEEQGIEPQLDIYINNPQMSVLIDAKDYRILDGTKISGTSNDHYKQIIYRYLVSSKTPFKMINILAFPVVGQSKLYEIRGVHLWRELADSCVFEVDVDYEIIVKKWLKEISIDVEKETADLLNLIKEYSSKIKSI
jgi:hypothetical protein